VGAKRFSEDVFHQFIADFQTFATKFPADDGIPRAVAFAQPDHGSGVGAAEFADRWHRDGESGLQNRNFVGV